MIEALVFDFDGVIIDTEIPSYETWQEVYAAHGAHLDRALWQRQIGGGTHTFDAIQHLEVLTGVRLDREAVRKSRKERHDALVRSTPLLPGVLEYIQEARRLGLKLGVASSSSHAWVEGHLAERGLLSLFQSVAAREDVAHIKPDPALYLVALQRLGVPPDRAVAIERKVLRDAGVDRDADFGNRAMRGRQYTWSAGETLPALLARRDEIVERHAAAMSRSSKKRTNLPLVEVLAEALDEDDDTAPCTVCAP